VGADKIFDKLADFSSPDDFMEPFVNFLVERNGKLPLHRLSPSPSLDIRVLHVLYKKAARSTRGGSG
jgi:hypothetical protein